MTSEEVDAYVDFLGARRSFARIPHRPRNRSARIRTTSTLIALARAAPVDALVSGDVHLLRLRRVIPVLTPREFLESLTEA